MKRSLLVLGTVLFLALLLVPSTSVSAANAVCTVSPSSGNVGTVFAIYCTGFVPGAAVTSWVTEPDGHVISWFGGKASASGTFGSAFGSTFGIADLALGDWAMTIQDVAGNVGIARWHLNGGVVGVSGANLTLSGSVLIGSGFLPFEFVTIWYDYPNGDCSGLLFGIGLSNQILANIKTDSAGGFAVPIAGGALACKGEYHFVARGNASGLGADTTGVFEGKSVNETGTMTASPSYAHVGNIVVFSGYGFLPGEPITCWFTSPMGQVGAIGGVNKADAAGHIGFGLATKYAIDKLFMGSLGAEGDWAVTCKGGASGAIAIAHFTLVGNMVDP